MYIAGTQLVAVDNSGQSDAVCVVAVVRITSEICSVYAYTCVTYDAKGQPTQM